MTNAFRKIIWHAKQQPLSHGFSLATLRRRPRSAAQKLAGEMARIRQRSINQLGDEVVISGRWLAKIFLRTEEDARRLYRQWRPDYCEEWEIKPWR